MGFSNLTINLETDSDIPHEFMSIIHILSSFHFELKIQLHAIFKTSQPPWVLGTQPITHISQLPLPFLADPSPQPSRTVSVPRPPTHDGHNLLLHRDPNPPYPLTQVPLAPDWAKNSCGHGTKMRILQWRRRR